MTRHPLLRASSYLLLAGTLAFTLHSWADDDAFRQYAPQDSHAAIKAVSVGTSAHDKFDPARTGTSFPEGTQQVLVWYRWADAQPGKKIGIQWSLGGATVLEQGETIDKPAGTAAWFLKLSKGSPLPSGNYQVELLEDDKVMTAIPFTIGKSQGE